MFYGSFIQRLRAFHQGTISENDLFNHMRRQFQGKMRERALSRGANRSTVDDLVNVELSKLLLAIRSGRFVVTSDEATLAYLKLRVSGEAISQLRSRFRRREVGLENRELAEERSKFALLAVEVRDVLRLLSAGDRSILEERFFENRTLSELANRRGCSISSAAARLEKAKEAFRVTAPEYGE